MVTVGYRTNGCPHVLEFHVQLMGHPMVIQQFAIEIGPVEIVDLPGKNGDFPVRKRLVYRRAISKIPPFPRPSPSANCLPNCASRGTRPVADAGGWALPLWLMMELVSWDDDILNIWKNKVRVPNHQPVWVSGMGRPWYQRKMVWKTWSHWVVKSHPPFSKLEILNLSRLILAILKKWGFHQFQPSNLSWFGAFYGPFLCFQAIFQRRELPTQGSLAGRETWEVLGSKRLGLGQDGTIWVSLEIGTIFP